MGDVKKRFTIEEIQAAASAKQQSIAKRDPEKGEFQGYNPNIYSNRTRSFTTEEQSDIDKYNSYKAASNKAYEELKARQETEKLNDSVEWYDRVGSMVSNTGAMIGSWAADILDVPDLRPSKMIPSSRNMIIALPGIYGFGKKLSHKVFGTEKVSEDEDADLKSMQIALDALLPEDPFTTQLELLDDYVFAPLDKLIGDENNPSNWLSEYFDERLAKRNAKYTIQSEFSLDSDMSIWTEEGAKWFFGGLQQGLPSLAASLVEGKIALAGMQGLKSLNSTIKTAKGAQDLNRAKNAMLKANMATQMGVSLALTHGESSQLMRDTYKRTLLTTANKQGGAEWEKRKEQIAQQVTTTGQEARDSDAIIQLDIETATREAIKDFFPEDSKEYKNIMETSEKAARLTYKLNSGIFLTNMLDAGFIMKGLKVRNAADKAIRGIGKVKHSRFITPKPTFFKGVRNVAAAGFTEGVIEEGGFNKYAEWKGIAFGEGNTSFNLSDFGTKFLAGEANEDIFFGTILGIGMPMLGDLSSVRTRKQKFKEYEKATKNWLKN